MFLIFPQTEGREICAPHEQVVCVSESFILTLGKEEIFGSWKLHLPFPSVHYGGFGTRWRTRGRTIRSTLAARRPINPRGNPTSPSHLPRRRCSASRPTRRVDPLVLCVARLFCTCTQSGPKRGQVGGGRDLYAPAPRGWEFTRE